MNLKQCILTANDCYKKSREINELDPIGIVVHSTGVNNPYLKRYVQPLETDEDYQEILGVLGRNTYDNHWNQPGIKSCVHAFIGKTAIREIAIYQTLPFTYCCWGYGPQKGSYNDDFQDKIQFTICEDSLMDEEYFTAVFQEAAEFCAFLCNRYHLSVSQIHSSSEKQKEGYENVSKSPDHWLNRFEKTMDDFRAQVKVLLDEHGLYEKQGGI